MKKIWAIVGLTLGILLTTVSATFVFIFSLGSIVMLCLHGLAGLQQFVNNSSFIMKLCWASLPGLIVGITLLLISQRGFAEDREPPPGLPRG